MSTDLQAPAATAVAKTRKTPLAKGGMPKLAVVIPCYNEEGAVYQTVMQVEAVLNAAGITHEIVVVNDGSTDNTLAEARRSSARVITYSENVGYGFALKTGIAGTRSEFVAIIDADGTYPPENLPSMLSLCTGADMVVGDRGAAMEGVPFIRRPAKWVLNNLASHLARQHINDLNSGLRVFKRPSLEQFVGLLPDGFSFTTTITLCMLASSLKVVYLPIVYGQRVGHSKIRAAHFFNFIMLVVRLTVYFQPLRVFMPVGAVFFLYGLAKAAYDMAQLNLSDSAVFGFLGAMLVWSLGLLGDMISRLHLHPRNQSNEG